MMTNSLLFLISLKTWRTISFGRVWWGSLSKRVLKKLLIPVELLSTLQNILNNYICLHIVTSYLLHFLPHYRIHSRCPIEEGVVQTDWGTVSPGTLMAAIAASVESQRVAVTDILNANIFKEDVAEPLMTSAMQDWYEDIETLETSQRQVEGPDISNVWVATLAGKSLKK